jgi:hypothetical protein
MSEWIKYDALPPRYCYDSRGKRIDKVRAVRIEDGGITVRILGTIDGGNLTVCERDGENIAAVEFEGFVRGGWVSHS